MIDPQMGESAVGLWLEVTAKNKKLEARVAALEATVKSRDEDIVGYVRTIEDTSKQQDEAEARVAELEGLLLGANRCIAELEKLRCDCGMKA